MFTFGLKKKDIACCLLCYSEAEYVFSKSVWNAVLHILVVAYLVAFFSAILFAPSALYKIIAFFVTSALGIFTKLLMDVELKCKKCGNSLLIKP
jgi:uncharacterized membrane protein